jgi:hypothetical protein
VNRLQSHYLGSLELRRWEASLLLDTFTLAEPHGYRFDPTPACLIEPSSSAAHTKKGREPIDGYRAGVALCGGGY